MAAPLIRLLFLEDNPGDFRLVQAKLADAAPGVFVITHVERLAAALMRLDAESFDIMLSDLGLPDSDALSTVQSIVAHSPTLPLVVLTGSGDDQQGWTAMSQGAEDYLAKGDASGAWIARTLRYAIERKRLEIERRLANAELAGRVAERSAELERTLARLNESLSSARALAETASDAIVTADRDGLILGWNRAAERMFGYSDAEAQGLSMTRMMPERYRSRHVAGMARVRDSGVCGVIGSTVEVYGLTKAGEEFPLELSLSTWIGAEGRMFAGIMRDISERKRAQAQLEDQQSHLEQLVRQRTAELSAALEAAKIADRTKDAFLANVSHEMRTPLTAVVGLAGLALRLDMPAKPREHLERIVDAGRNLTTLINDLLDLAKIASGFVRMESVVFSPRQMLASVVAMMEERASAKHLQLAVHVADDLEAVVIGDSSRVGQILINLLSNALKFTAQGSIDLRLSSRPVEGGRVRIEVEVTDTGIGMSEADLAGLFQPFAQADASITRRFGGTGLGLALSKRLIELMEGEITVNSVPGVGSRFAFFVILALGRADELDEQLATVPHAVDWPQAGRRILVVDDEPINREIASALLAAPGREVAEAGNGVEALEMLLAAHASQPFDLVLMDVQMPVMDGLAATRRIREFDGLRHLPIIAMTAHTMEHEKQNILAAGMNDHIGKPFDVETFSLTVGRWLSTRNESFVAVSPAPSFSCPVT